MWYSVHMMMNDMMPTIDETISMNDIAQHEHEQWLRECEREERWAAIEATHGPLLEPDQAALVLRAERAKQALAEWFSHGTMK